MYALFGERFGYIEYLGRYHKYDLALRAYDDFWAAGYSNLKILI